MPLTGLPARRLSLGFEAVRRLRQVYGPPISARVGREMAARGARLSLLDRVQRNLWRHRLAQIPLAPPIFIIGHWRSGATRLHDLLCRDARFACPTVHACSYPQRFLWSRSDATRTLPQDDEFALLCLGSPSPYDALLYPQCLPDILDRADPAELDAADRAAWERRFLGFLGGVNLVGGGRRIVLNSPAHSLRIACLVRLLPDARFVHIVRDPAAVYASTLRMWREAMATYAIGPPICEADLRRSVRRIMVALDNAVADAAAALGPQRYQCIRYETLEADPLTTLAGLYGSLGLGAFDRVGDLVAGAVALQQDRRAIEAPLRVREIAALIRDCGLLYDRYGYVRPDDGADGPSVLATLTELSA